MCRRKVSYLCNQPGTTQTYSPRSCSEDLLHCKERTIPDLCRDQALNFWFLVGWIHELDGKLKKEYGEFKFSWHLFRGQGISKANSIVISILVNFLTSHDLVSMCSLDVKFLFRCVWTVAIIEMIEDDALNSTRVGTGCLGDNYDRPECKNAKCQGVGHCDGRWRVDSFDWRGVLSVDHCFNTGCIMHWVLFLNPAWCTKNFCWNWKCRRAGRSHHVITVQWRQAPMGERGPSL